MTTQARELAKLVTNAGDLNLGDDISLASDGAVLNFGADSDVTLTHVADTGLLLNSSRRIQFGDSGTHIRQSADGVLNITSDTEVEINATTVDINANVDISGNLVLGGNITIGDADSDDISFGGELTSHIVPNATNTFDLGTASKEWRNAFFDGTVTSDAFAGPLTGDVTGNVTGNASGTAATVTGAAQTNITSLGTLTGLTVSGTTNLDGAIQVDNTITVGVDDTGYDVKFFGDTASAYMLWDASADDLILGGSAGISAQALTASGVTKLNGGVVFNEDSADVDFRVESNDSANMLHVDGGNNKVLVQAVNTASVTDSASMIAASAFEINGNSGEGSDILRFFAMADGTGNYGMEVSNSGGNAQYDLALNPINGGAVLIGATTNAVHGNVDDLQVGNGVGHRGIGIHSGNTSNGSIFFSDTDSTLSGQLEYVHASDYLAIITGGNQRLRIDAHGVKFNTNTAQTDALDDYEEGSWTIGVSSSDPGSMSVTVSNGYGWYVKVGNMVTVGGSFDLSTSSPQGTMRITGLPYGCSSNGTRPLYVGVVGYTINVVPQPNLVTMGNGSTADYLDVWKIGNNTRYNVSDFNNGGRMNFQISYEAD